MADSRVKMECAQCGRKCFPVWLGNKAYCKQCDAVLQTHPESELRQCQESPDGLHHWKFGKCSHCQKPEHSIVHSIDAMTNPDGEEGCAHGGRCLFKFARCTKCGRREGLFSRHDHRIRSLRIEQDESHDVTAKSPSRQSSGELSIYNQIPVVECLQSRSGLHHWKFGRCTCCHKCEGKIVHDGGAMANPGGEAGCPTGGKCMFKFAKCTKCGRNELEHRPVTPILHARRISGESGANKQVSNGTTETDSSVCHKSPDEVHHWKFGKCSYCHKPECQIVHSSRARPSVDESQRSSSPMPKQQKQSNNTTQVDGTDNGDGCESVPVGGGLKAVRKLLRSQSHAGSDASTSAGSDDEAPKMKNATACLHDAFQTFCGFSTDMDAKHFSKLCKDCQLLDKSFSATDVDIVFDRAVKGRRRVSWSNFEDLLRLVAEKKGVAHEQVLTLVSHSQGQALRATR